MTIHRIRLILGGSVQGVGFRPFVYRLASSLSLKGQVSNSAQGVIIEVEGQYSALQDFQRKIVSEKPIQSFISSIKTKTLEPIGYKQFTIEASQDIPQGDKTAVILADMATCSDCLLEIFDPCNRRYLYPFTNCTNCGPRFSIIQGLPYDRKKTTMKNFLMCSKCLDEYLDPKNRRFHAQPNACSTCGPHLELWSLQGKVMALKQEALHKASCAILKGHILALKGLGGFHLIVDALNDQAISLLRKRKNRAYKPFALMYPNLESIDRDCNLSAYEKKLLTSSKAPIVLLQKRNDEVSDQVSKLVAPQNSNLGVMLPYTPLHHLLMAEVQRPLVVTSGNIGGDPIYTNEKEALFALKEIADIFLVHNRPIHHPVDDSLVRVVMDQELVIRRSRGYAPLPIYSNFKWPSIFAMGGELKNTQAFSLDNKIFIGQHIGDLETSRSLNRFNENLNSFTSLYNLKVEKVVSDLHPNYRSTRMGKRWSEKLKAPLIKVQHHWAHLLSTMCENSLKPPILGVVFDGTGFGEDQTVWGGEFLKITNNSFQRSGHFKTFPLPGGEKAVLEPRRSCLGLMFSIYKDKIFEMKELSFLDMFTKEELKNLKIMLSNKINSPLSSSVGRIFDAVCSLLNIEHYNSFEGQAAMKLEMCADSSNSLTTDLNYDYKIENFNKKLIVDLSFSIKGIIQDQKDGKKDSTISLKFHQTLAKIVQQMVLKLGTDQIVLSGGCFQNKLLLEKTVNMLKQIGAKVYWSQQIPPNDGGLALGQIMAACPEMIFDKNIYFNNSL